MMHRNFFLANVVSAVLLLLASCHSSNETPDSEANGAVTDRKLSVLGSDEAFLEALRAGLAAQSNHYYGAQVTAEGGAVEFDSDSSADSSGESASNEVTSTNVQELGVDEQDWVKVSGDGQQLYVLDNGNGYAGGIAEDVVVLEEDRDPLNDSSDIAENSMTLRILQLDANAPDASSLKDLTLDLEGRYAEGFYLYERESKTDAVLTSSGDFYWAYWSESEAFGGISSLITRVDVSDPGRASINGKLHIDGQIISSRRIGQYLFLASRFYPQIPGEDPYGQTPEQWFETVQNASVTDLLPQYSLEGSDGESSLIDPANCFVSANVAEGEFYSPDIITLAVVDLETLQITDSECYLGASETLYASPQSVFLATTQYDYSIGPVAEAEEAVSVEDGEFPGEGVSWSDPRVDTDIHQFTIESDQLVYVGSGTVAGHLGWNELRKPFRMSHKDGYLRVATVNAQQGGGNESPILLSVLQPAGEGELTTVSRLPNESNPAFIGKPGEQLYASRFLGNRAYLVTFRQTDPLYVIDLTNPANPFIAGELEIEGYSDYLHPIDDDYLLGIGRDAVVPSDDAVEDDLERGGLVQGIKLSLFNVSNPAEPREVQSLLVGQRGSQSQALYDHRAVTVQKASDEHPTRVGFGIEVNGEAFPASSPSSATAGAYYPWSYTGFHGFEVTTGADAGIVSVGALVAESAGSDSNAYYYSSGVRDRSVMVNDSLFYIHGDRVYAAPWSNLAAPTPAR